jgi:hypothetical protein
MRFERLLNAGGVLKVELGDVRDDIGDRPLSTRTGMLPPLLWQIAHVRCQPSILILEDLDAY